MTSPLDTYRAAHMVMQQRGAQALAHAEQRAAELVQAGDAAGRATWRRVRAAIEALEKAASADRSGVQIAEHLISYQRSRSYVS